MNPEANDNYENIDRNKADIICIGDENKPIDFIIYSNNINAEGLVLNEKICISKGVKPYVPEIKISSISEISDSEIKNKQIKIRIYNIDDDILGERTWPISKLEKSVETDGIFEPVIYVSNDNLKCRFDDKLKPEYIGEVHVFIG